jgi:Cu-Zn family superoxide dismutase
MIRWKYGVLLSALGLLGAACQSQSQATPKDTSDIPKTEGKAVAIATFKAKPESKAAGTVTFTQEGDKVRAVIEVSGASPGPHGIHVHEKADCSAPDFSSAGGHWNPSGQPHACPPAGEHHPGDLGNIEVKEDGRGRGELTLEHVTLNVGVGEEGPQSLLGKSVILHEGKDDCTSQPSGESGGRLACAVIQMKQ